MENYLCPNMQIQRPGKYKRTDNQSSVRLLLAALFLVGIMFLFWYKLKDYQAENIEKIPDVKEYLPEAKQGTIYHKPHFSISYVEEYEIPEWVAYKLTVDMMNSPKSPRDQDFNPDPAIITTSAHYHDYKQSGYRRGHLVPSADMAWNKEAMDATFLLSNIAPMLETFNDGIWLELEHNIRDWSRAYKEVTVLAGPVFDDPITTIGKNEVLVPRKFFKAVLTYDNKEPKVIGFLFDQTSPTHGRLEDYVVSIDSIEKVTGLDLFSNLYGNWDKEIALEKTNSTGWNFNEKWYLERTNN